MSAEGRGRLRILHVLEATLGGTLRYLENLQEALEESDLSIGFAYGSLRGDHRLEPMLVRARKMGWHTFPVNMRREISVGHDATACLELLRVVRTFRPHIIHCHSSKAGALGRVASLACFPRPCVVYSPHAISVALGRVHMVIERLLSTVTSSFLAVSDSEREQLLSLGLTDPSRVNVLYPSLDTEYYSPRPQAVARRELGLPDTPIVVGVGRLAMQKDPVRFLNILAQLRQRIPIVTGVWVGDGELRKDFTGEVSRLGLTGSVIIAGWQTDVRPWLAAADVLLSTSLYESFGYMVAEALAMGRPVVASRICGTVDILTGELATCLFDEPSEAVEALTRTLSDPARAENLARAGRAHMTRFSKARMSEDLPRYYRGLLSPA